MTLTSLPPETAPAPQQAARRALGSARPLRRAGLLSVGAAVPRTVVSGETLASPFGRTAAWIEQRTGIRELRRLAAGETLEELAGRAADDALAASPGPVDLVMAASCSVPTDQPSLAPSLAARLAPDAATVDLNAACAGFCYSLAVAQQAIATGAARRVLVVGAEQMSRLVNPTDLGTSIIFADGAGAAVVGALQDGDGVGIGPVEWGSDGAGADVIDMPDGRHLRMQGQAVFRWAVDEMHHVAAAAARKAGVALEAIDVFVPHQANARIVEAMARRLGVRGAVADSVHTAGNTSAASIPLALTRLGDRHRGQLALLVGFGAGLAYAAQVVRLPA